MNTYKPNEKQQQVIELAKRFFLQAKNNGAEIITGSLERLDEKQLQKELSKSVGETLLAEIAEAQQRVAMLTLINKIKSDYEGTENVDSISLNKWASITIRMSYSLGENEEKFEQIFFNQVTSYDHEKEYAGTSLVDNNTQFNSQKEVDEAVAIAISFLNKVKKYQTKCESIKVDIKKVIEKFNEERLELITDYLKSNGTIEQRHGSIIDRANKAYEDAFSHYLLNCKTHFGQENDNESVDVKKALDEYGEYSNTGALANFILDNRWIEEALKSYIDTDDYLDLVFKRSGTKLFIFTKDEGLEITTADQNGFKQYLNIDLKSVSEGYPERLLLEGHITYTKPLTETEYKNLIDLIAIFKRSKKDWLTTPYNSDITDIINDEVLVNVIDNHELEIDAFIKENSNYEKEEWSNSETFVTEAMKSYNALETKMSSYEGEYEKILVNFEILQENSHEDLELIKQRSYLTNIYNKRFDTEFEKMFKDCTKEQISKIDFIKLQAYLEREKENFNKEKGVLENYDTRLRVLYSYYEGVIEELAYEGEGLASKEKEIFVEGISEIIKQIKQLQTFLDEVDVAFNYLEKLITDAYDKLI